MREPGPPAVIWFEQKQTADSNCRSSLTKLQLTSVKHAFFIFVISFSCIFFTQMTRAVPPASCRIRVELFVENATPAGILWAIIMPPSNSGRSQIPRPSILARGLFLSFARFPFPLAFPLYTSAHGSHFRLGAPSIRLLARHPHSLSRYILGSASYSNQCSSTPLDHLLATDGRNCPPQSTAHARSYVVRHMSHL